MTSLIFISFLIVAVQTLQTPFVIDRTISTTSNDFSVDELGNLYLINGFSITRYNASTNTVFATSELNYGDVEYFDVTNPMKPFVHYRTSGKVVIFDNTLSQQGDPIDLFEKGYEQVELVAGSRGDAYWLWDSRNSEMIRVDQNFQKLTSTGNLSVLLGKTISPDQILERGDHLYLRDKSYGVFVFDIYGTYRTLIGIQTSQDIQVVNNQLIYFDHSSVHVLSADWVTEEILDLPLPDSIRVFFANGKLYRLIPGSLEIWKFEGNRRN